MLDDERPPNGVDAGFEAFIENDDDAAGAAVPVFDKENPKLVPLVGAALLFEAGARLKPDGFGSFVDPAAGVEPNGVVLLLLEPPKLKPEFVDPPKLKPAV